MRCSHFLLVWPILRAVGLPTPQDSSSSDAGADPTDLDRYYGEQPAQDPAIGAAKSFGTNVVLPAAVVAGLYSRFRNPEAGLFQSNWHRPGTWGIGEKIKATTKKISEIPGNLKEMPGQLKTEIADIPGQMQKIPGKVKEIPGAAAQKVKDIQQWPERQIQKWAENRVQKYGPKQGPKQKVDQELVEQPNPKETRPKTPTEELMAKKDQQLKDEMTDAEHDEYLKCVQTRFWNHMTYMWSLERHGDPHTGRAVQLKQKDLDPEFVRPRMEAECVRKYKEKLLDAMHKERDAKDALARVAKESGTTETGGAGQPQKEEQKVPAGVNPFQGVENMMKGVQSTASDLADRAKNNFIRIAGAGARAQPHSGSAQPGMPMPMPEGVPAGLPKMVPF